MSLAERTMKKVKWHLIPICCIMYFVNYLDRTNLGYAALTMNKELGISSLAYGALTSIFYVSYFFFEVPSNMLMNRIGARKVLSRIMITWGFVTVVTMFVQNYWQLYGLRFLLGVMEAGFLPGVMFYFSFWFPQRMRAQVNSLFMLTLPITGVIASPLSGWILDHVKLLGFAGWRWLFMFEGIPAIIVGIVILIVFIDKPSQAKWLDDDEKKWLEEEITKEDAKKAEKKHVPLKEMFTNGRTWRLGIIYMFMAFVGSAIPLFIPMVIKDLTKGSNTMVGLFNALPYFAACIVMVFWGRHSDKTMERKYHSAAALGLGALGLIMAAFIPGSGIKMVGIIIAQCGAYSVLTSFWAIPQMFLTLQTAAVGMAIIASCNSLGSFAGGYISGYLRSISNNVLLAFYGLCYIIAIILLITLPLKKPKKTEKSESPSEGASA